MLKSFNTLNVLHFLRLAKLSLIKSILQLWLNFPWVLLPVFFSEITSFLIFCVCCCSKWCISDIAFYYFIRSIVRVSKQIFLKTNALDTIQCLLAKPGSQQYRLFSSDNIALTYVVKKL